MKFFLLSVLLIVPVRGFSGTDAGTPLKNNWFAIRKANSILVVGNTDQIGYVEPCGCRKVPVGGSKRRFNAIGTLPRERLIQVDAGNLLFPSAHPNEKIKATWEAQANAVLHSFSELKLDAFAIGPNDLALGPEALVQMQKQAKFPFLSANLRWRKTNKSVFPGYTSINRGGKNVFIAALTAPVVAHTDIVKFEPAPQSLATLVGQDEFQSAELRILLTSFNRTEVSSLLSNSGMKFDLIVYGNGGENEDAEVKDNSIFMTNSGRGQAISIAEISKGLSHWNLEQYKFVELGLEFDRNETGTANPMRPILNLLASRMREIDVEIARKFREATHHTNSQPYESFMKCAQCHQRQANFQNTKPHAAAFLTLVRNEAVTKLDCIKCHSVGFQDPRGFKDVDQALQTKDGKNVDYRAVLASAELDSIVGQAHSYRFWRQDIPKDVAKWQSGLAQHGVSRALLGVQCESCHTPKANHPIEDAGIVAAVDTNRCLQCHTQDQSPEWYKRGGVADSEKVAEALEKVACIK